MSQCVDNARMGRTGCGATYTGNSSHSVAKVPWSQHADGMAHVTFKSDEACRACWVGGTMSHPATVINAKTGEPTLEQDHRGRWRKRRRIGSGDGPNTDADTDA